MHILLTNDIHISYLLYILLVGTKDQFATMLIISGATRLILGHCVMVCDSSISIAQLPGKKYYCPVDSERGSSNIRLLWR